MAIHSILNEGDDRSVMFRNREAPNKFGVWSERDDVFLAVMSNHVYPANRRPGVPWARSQAEFDGGNRFEVVVDRPGSDPLIHYVWEHDGHIRSSVTGWSTAGPGNKIPGDSAAGGTKVLVVGVNGSLRASNVRAAEEVEEESVTREQRMWFFFTHGSSKEQMSTWYLGRPAFIFGSVSNPSWHGRPMRLIPVDPREPRAGVMLADEHEGTLYYVSTDQVEQPGSGPVFKLTTERTKAVRVHPRFKEDRVYFLLDNDPVNRALTSSTAGGAMSFAPLMPRNRRPLRQYFEYELVQPAQRFWIVQDASGRVFVPKKGSPDAVIEVATRAEDQPAQWWNLDLREKSIVHDETGLALDVNTASALCLARRQPEKPTQKWELTEEGFLANGAGDLATLEGALLYARARIEPPSPSQLWHAKPYVDE